IRPIIGAELTIATESGESGRSGRSGEEDDVTSSSDLTDPTHPTHQTNPTFLLPVLCESQDGYRNLCRLITRMKMRAPKGEGALTLEDLDGSTRGLVALAGRAVLWAPGAPGAPFNGRNGVGGPLDRLVGLFGRDNVYIELQRHF